MDTTWQEFLRELEQVRAISPSVGTTVRATDDDDESLGVMSGHFSTFNTWYEIDSRFEGNFLERIAPGAFKRTIDAHHDSSDGRIKVLFSHGMDFNIGDKVLGAIRELREDDTGPYYEVPLFDTTYNRDLLPGLKSDPSEYGSSFRFRVLKDEWVEEPEPSDHNPRGIPERTIKEVRVPEFGPTPFPANPTATAAVRSMTDDFYDRMRERHPDRYEELLTRARQIRTPEPEPAERTSGDGPADPTEDPPEGHSEVMTRAERQQRVRQLRVIRSGR